MVVVVVVVVLLREKSLNCLHFVAVLSNIYVRVMD